MNNNKISTLFLIPSLYTGGAEMRALDIARHIRPWNNTILACSQSPDLECLRNDFRSLGAKYEPAFIFDDPQYAKTQTEKIVNISRSFISTIRLILRYKPHNVFITMPSPSSTLGSILACALFKKRSVIRFALVTDGLRFSPTRKRLLNWAKERNQIWVALSEDSRKTLCRTMERPLSGIHLIYNGFCRTPGSQSSCFSEPSLRNEFSLPEHARLVLTVGSLIHRKGPDLLIPTVPHILEKHPDVFFLWAGANEKDSRYRSLIEEYGIQQHVILLGNREDIPRLMQETDLFVFPTRYEGFPSAVLEAIYYRLPVISFNTSSIPEIITHRVTGLLARKEDPCDLQANILYALEHPHEMRTYAERALNILDTYSVKSMMNSYAKLLGKGQ